MVRRIVIGSCAATVALALLTATALAGNPAGTGQPGANCEEESMMPAGFGTSGFALAAARYAGSDGTASLAHANSPAAVSQYDVACYQILTHH